MGLTKLELLMALLVFYIILGCFLDGISSVVLTMAPASERGQALLMKGRDLWVFLPRVSQPVRLSLAQRLTGQVANGDLAGAHFSGD